MALTYRVEVEYYVVQRLREWLALNLPNKVTELNGDRVALLRTPRAGPYTIPSGAVLNISTTTRDAADVSVSLTAGSRTAAQIVSQINAVAASLSSVDSWGRVLLTSPAPPVVGNASLVAVAPDTTGANIALGWDDGGEFDERTALQAPGFKGLLDGDPLMLDPTTLQPGALLVLFGERRSVPAESNTRTDAYFVDVDMALMRVEPQNQQHRNREPMHACLRAVRELLLTDIGRYAGMVQTQQQAILRVQEVSARIGANPVALQADGIPNTMLDIAELKLRVIAFERPNPVAP